MFLYGAILLKPPSEREGDRDSGGRSLRDLKVLMHAGSLGRLRRQLPPGGSLSKERENFKIRFDNHPFYI